MHITLVELIETISLRYYRRQLQVWSRPAFHCMASIITAVTAGLGREPCIITLPPVASSRPACRCIVTAGPSCIVTTGPLFITSFHQSLAITHSHHVITAHHHGHHRPAVTACLAGISTLSRFCKVEEDMQVRRYLHFILRVFVCIVGKMVVRRTLTWNCNIIYIAYIVFWSVHDYNGNIY